VLLYSNTETQLARLNYTSTKCCRISPGCWLYRPTCTFWWAFSW